MQEVILQRQEKSGKEHGLTLWAIADLARVKSARGEHGEAEADFRAGLPIVESNLAKTRSELSTARPISVTSSSAQRSMTRLNRFLLLLSMAIRGHAPITRISSSDCPIF